MRRTRIIGTTNRPRWTELAAPRTEADNAERSRRWILTSHSRQRMREMSVSRWQVLEALEEAEVTYPARGGAYFSKKGSIAVCWCENRVITVCPNTYERYERPGR